MNAIVFAHSLATHFNDPMRAARLLAGLEARSALVCLGLSISHDLYAFFPSYWRREVRCPIRHACIVFRLGRVKFSVCYFSSFHFVHSPYITLI